jgi:cell division protein FtsI/penicillin-binding protein 2
MVSLRLSSFLNRLYIKAMSHTTASSQRLFLIKISVALFFGATVFYQARVQTWGSRQILNNATKTKRFEFTSVEVARRGSIFFADGKAAAQDEDTRQLTVEFNKVPKSRAFFMDLSAATGIAASEFDQLAAAKVPSRVWYKPMSREQSTAILDLKRRWRGDGISLERTGRRTYELGDAASGFIGSVRERLPQSGMELSQNKVLSGTNGETTGLVDRTGAFLPMRTSGTSTKAVDGQNITLTIDSTLQLATAAAIRNVVEANKADAGVAIVIDPQTGDILAMANWPSFDPTSKAQIYNPCYTMQLEPGSTFKILTLAKALDKGVTSPSSTVYCSGTLRINHKSAIHCEKHGGSGAHGLVTPELAIAKSCNVAAATWARAIGYSDMVAYLRALGLFNRSTLGLPFEQWGRFNFEEYAKQLQLANVGFGQSITVTPVLLAGAFSMIGNNGVRMEPRIIKKIGDKEQPLKPGKRLISANAATTTIHCMEAVIESKEGTGSKLKIPGYRLAGKTGTAQKIDSTFTKKGPKRYVANFVGFVPAPNPRAMILVMVDNPKAGQYYGGSVAGPVFVEIAKAVIHRYGIPPSKGVSTAATPKVMAPANLKNKDKNATNRSV